MLLTGLGRNNVFRWDISKCRWLKLTENVELVRDTLIYGELIQELRGEGRSQKRSSALHIVDAVILGGVDVSKLHLKERLHEIVVPYEIFTNFLNLNQDTKRYNNIPMPCVNPVGLI